MTTADAPERADSYVNIRALAVRWGVSVPTARNRTRSEGFPAPLMLGPRSSRWPLEEVEAWERAERTRPRTPYVGRSLLDHARPVARNSRLRPVRKRAIPA